MAPRGGTSTPLPRACFAVFHSGQKIRTGVLCVGHKYVPSMVAGNHSGPPLWAWPPLVSVSWCGASFPWACRVRADAQ